MDTFFEENKIAITHYLNNNEVKTAVEAYDIIFKKQYSQHNFYDHLKFLLYFFIENIKENEKLKNWEHFTEKEQTILEFSQIVLKTSHLIRKFNTSFLFSSLDNHICATYSIFQDEHYLNNFLDKVHTKNIKIDVNKEKKTTDNFFEAVRYAHLIADKEYAEVWFKSNAFLISDFLDVSIKTHIIQEDSIEYVGLDRFKNIPVIQEQILLNNHITKDNIRKEILKINKI